MMVPRDHIAFTSAQAVNEICTPLKNHFGIPTFAYAKLFHDGSAINLHSNPPAVKNYYDQKLYQLSSFDNPPANYQSGFILWSMVNTHPIILKTREQFGVGHGVTFINKMVNATEIFHFAGAYSDQTVQHTIINNLDLLERFAYLFKKKAAQLIKKGEKSKLMIGLEERPNNFVNQGSCYLRKSEVRQQFLIDCAESLCVQPLSSRETECLRLLMSGKTAKDIALSLGLSKRTIEHYLDNIKLKFNVASKHDLLIKLYNQHEPISWE